MKKISIFLFTVLAVTLLACNNQPQSTTDTIVNELPTKNSNELVDGHTAQNSLSWPGRYEGTLPCADCPGIKTMLELNQDGSFHYMSYYMERKVDTTHMHGTIQWQNNGSQIILVNNGVPDSSMQFFVKENAIEKLDMEGKKIDGDIGRYYELKMTENFVER